MIGVFCTLIIIVIIGIGVPMKVAEMFSKKRDD
ncbi:hypothetical protein LCGC14_1067580 [marine sediment metagenome]|uniref:Uncharacterized protein n=1 Tax=marine sediment metagenome TaxID=412755 RepID=A0A0F9QQ27_9ZZZZ